MNMEKQRDLLTIGDKIIIKEIKNPFLEIKESGLDLLTDEHISNETGNTEKSDQTQRIAKVIKVGKDCTQVKEGDLVFYYYRVAEPVPYKGLGYHTIHEGSINAILR